MTNRKFIAVFFVLSALSAFNATGSWAAEFKCGEAKFVSAPKLEKDLFTAQMTSECTVTGANGGGTAALEKDLLRKATQVDQIHEGPVSAEFKGLKATRFDVTVKLKREEGSGSIRSIVHIGSNDLDRLIYSSVSKEIKASGMAAYLRKMDLEFTVVRVEGDGNYRIVLNNLIQIKRPWYAPGGVFTDMAKKNSLEQFTKNRDKLLPDVVREL